MNYFQESYSETSSTHNSVYSSSNFSQTTPPLASTPASTPGPVIVPPLRPKKILSLGAQEFVPTTPPGFKHQDTAMNGNEYAYTVDGVFNQRGGNFGVSNNGTVPLNVSTHCSLLNNAAQNQLLLRQQQILHEKQQLLQRQQQELAAATIAKQQIVMSATAGANHPQDEISNSLKMFAVLSACKGNETPPSPEEVMQDFATNGFTTDELNRYQQYQSATNIQMLSNSIALPSTTQHFNNVDYNMNIPNGNINWLYSQQQLLQENINAYNELWRQNFLSILPAQLRRQAETAAAAAATAAAINMDYNSQNKPLKRSNFKKESQLIIRRCVFCENNNEPEAVVKSHAVRDAHGRVLCPKLRIYVCPICGASGDDAHTVKYCPQKPVITMEEAIKGETNRMGKIPFSSNSSRTQV